MDRLPETIRKALFESIEFFEGSTRTTVRAVATRASDDQLQKFYDHFVKSVR